jgi:hypothetical protein
MAVARMRGCIGAAGIIGLITARSGQLLICYVQPYVLHSVAIRLRDLAKHDILSKMAFRKI